MLTTQRNARSAISSNDDIIHETGKRRDTPNKEGCDGPPVAGVPGGVPVHAVEVVHVGYGYVASADDVVTAREKGLVGGHGIMI